MHTIPPPETDDEDPPKTTILGHRVVRFFPQARVRKTLHKKDYSEEEIQACWLTTQDFQRMRRAQKVHRMLLRMGMDVEYYEENSCSSEE